MPALLDSRRWMRAPHQEDYIAGEDVWFLRGSNVSFGRSGGAVRIMKPKPEMVQMWEDDIANCEGCKIEGMNPNHGTTSIFADGSLYTYQCRSGSRALNPVKGEIVGRAHCTCDGCY